MSSPRSTPENFLKEVCAKRLKDTGYVDFCGFLDHLLDNQILTLELLQGALLLGPREEWWNDFLLEPEVWVESHIISVLQEQFENDFDVFIRLLCNRVVFFNGQMYTVSVEGDVYTDDDEASYTIKNTHPVVPGDLMLDLPRNLHPDTRNNLN